MSAMTSPNQQQKPIDNRMPADEDEEILDFVKRLSLKEFKTEQQTQQGNGNHTTLTQWATMTDQGKLTRAMDAADAAGVGPAADGVDMSKLSFEEQIKYAMEVSERENARKDKASKEKIAAAAMLSRPKTPPPVPSASTPLQPEKSEEELIAEALARSMDPSEQENEFVGDILRATRISGQQPKRPDDFDFQPVTRRQQLAERAGASTGARSKTITTIPSTPSPQRAPATGAGIIDIPAEPDFDEEQVLQAIRESTKYHPPAPPPDQAAGAQAGFDERELALALKKSRELEEKRKLLEEMELNDLVSNRRPERGSLRPVAIDGSNVAFSHGNGDKFSPQGLLLAYHYFFSKMKNENVKIFTTRKHVKSLPKEDKDLMDRLDHAGILVYVEAKNVGGQYFAPYDDLAILDYAEAKGAVVVSNDLYRDIQRDYPQYKEVIKDRCTTYHFVGDAFFIPEDPCGRNGPKRDEFLRF